MRKPVIESQVRSRNDTNIVTNIDDEDIKYKVVPTLLIEEEHMFITERARNHVVDIM